MLVITTPKATNSELDITINGTDISDTPFKVCTHPAVFGDYLKLVLCDTPSNEAFRQLTNRSSVLALPSKDDMLTFVAEAHANPRQKIPMFVFAYAEYAIETTYPFCKNYPTLWGKIATALAVCELILNLPHQHFAHSGFARYK